MSPTMPRPACLQGSSPWEHPLLHQSVLHGPGEGGRTGPHGWGSGQTSSNSFILAMTHHVADAIESSSHPCLPGAQWVQVRLLEGEDFFKDLELGRQPGVPGSQQRARHSAICTAASATAASQSGRAEESENLGSGILEARAGPADASVPLIHSSFDLLGPNTIN